MTPSSQLIHIEDANFNGELTKTVNARELHANLEIKRKFSEWLPEQLRRAELTDGEDYCYYSDSKEGTLAGVYHINVTPESGGRPAQDCALTVSAALHISMMSNTVAGKKIRKYFIQVEKDYNNLRVANAGAQALLEAEPRLLKQVEAKYRDGYLLHHPDKKLGEDLKKAVRMRDHDSAGYRNKELDAMDFAPAARVQGVSVETIRQRIGERMAGLDLLGHLQRGEHEHRDCVLDVIQLAQAQVQAEDIQERIKLRQLADAKRPQTITQLLAQDMLEKHKH